MSGPALEIARMLVLSTSHLSETTCNVWLHSCPWSAFEKGGYGWFVYVCDDLAICEAPGVPLELRSALHVARLAGCQWIMFDRDGDTVPALPEFDW